MNQLLHFLNPIRVWQHAISSYRTRNNVFDSEAKYCYKCHSMTNFDKAETCSSTRCPMNAMPF